MPRTQPSKKWDPSTLSLSLDDPAQQPDGALAGLRWTVPDEQAEWEIVGIVSLVEAVPVLSELHVTPNYDRAVPTKGIDSEVLRAIPVRRLIDEVLRKAPDELMRRRNMSERSNATLWKVIQSPNRYGQDDRAFAARILRDHNGIPDGVIAGANAASAVPTPKHPRTKPDEFYRGVARKYVALAAANPTSRKLLQLMAESEGVPYETMRTWISVSRDKRFLAPTKQGRSSATPGPLLDNNEGDVQAEGADDGQH